MKRTLLALALWLCASAAQAQWTTIAGDACLVLTAGSCFPQSPPGDSPSALTCASLVAIVKTVGRVRVS